MQSRTNKINSSKPVNINISFTINPKNVLNQGITQSAPKKLRDAAHARSAIKAPTPDLLSTERPQVNRNRKRNSIDQSQLHQVVKINQPSQQIKKLAETAFVRKSSSKPKRKSDFSGKRTHNKTASKMSAFQNAGLRSAMFEHSTGIDMRKDIRKSLKQSINKIVTAELSKKSLPLAMPTQQNKSARKKKAKKYKGGQSQNNIKNGNDAIDRQKLIEKLTSLRSMNNSLFQSKTEQETEEKHRNRGTIIVHTDQSMECIDQIHNMEIQRRFNNLDRQESRPEDKKRANETRNLIETYISILNQHLDQEHDISDEDIEEQGIQQDFEEFKRLHEEHRARNNQEPVDQSYDDVECVRDQQNINLGSPIQNNQQKFVQNDMQAQKISNEERKEIKGRQQQQKLRPFCSSQMTKQQKLINQLERVRLHELKKHEVEKWSQLLTFIKDSISSGKSDTGNILESVYRFLQQTKNDLQRQLGKSPQKQKDQLEEFTNQLSSNLKVDVPEVYPDQNLNQKNQFDQISSMSYRDEDYEEDNDELKLMNLEMIQNALRVRHQTLLQKKERQLRNLEDKKNMGKITDKEYQKQCIKIQKWTKKETKEIAQARKNLWRGYNQAKGIIEKTLKSRQFQEQSAKKKGMMKCLSEDYLLKANYKSLLKGPQEQEQKSSESKESEQKIVQRVSSESQEGEESQPSLHHDKQTLELRELGEEEDMDVIKERLLDIKQKHLKEDGEDEDLDSDMENYEGIKAQDKEVSYEEVDNELQQSYEDDEMKIINQQLGRGLIVPKVDIQDERLKHLLPQDKEDIFEFIFLDLSIELYQEPCQDNKIMDAINKHVAAIKRQANKKKGVKTNLNVIKEYVKRFTGYITRVHKDTLNTLDEPVGPTAIQMLRYMHDSEEEPREEEQVQTTLVLPTSIFDQFERQLLPTIEFETYYENDQQRETRRVQFLKNVLHIHNKAIFDSMNEYLDLLRPFGLWGKPFPWKKAPAFLHLTSEQEKQQKLKKASDKVVEYCSFVCGLLVDKEESLVGNARLSEEYLEQIKEDRLSRMLATDLMDNEERWLFYDDQETQVLVQIANYISNALVKQAMMELM